MKIGIIPAGCRKFLEERALSYRCCPKRGSSEDVVIQSGRDKREILELL